MTPQDFLYLPCDILGDAYDNLIANAINEAADLAPDSESDQKNIVSYRYWEAINNKIMLEPARQSTLTASDEYTDPQLKYVQTQMNKYARLVSDYIPELAMSGYFEVVF